MTSDQICSGVLRGDDAAVAELYAVVKAQQWRCYARAGIARSEAEDITQESFLHAWSAVSRLRAHGALVYVVQRIVERRISAHLRRTRREVEVETGEEIDQSRFSYPARQLDDLIAAEKKGKVLSFEGGSLGRDILLRKLAGEQRESIIAALSITATQYRLHLWRAKAALTQKLAA